MEIEWENYRIVRDLFVFSCFSGLAISDVRNLREENIVLEEGELCIKGRRMKTKTPYRVQVLPPAWAIMERYRGKRAGFVFDVPTTDIILNGMHYIQRNIGMETPLTFHMAKHRDFYKHQIINRLYCLLIKGGNDKETSELLYSTLFCHFKEPLCLLQR